RCRYRFAGSIISFKLLYGLVTAAGYYQRDSNPTAESIAGQATDAFPWDEAPSHLIRDRDAAFGSAYTRCIRGMGIRDHPTAPRSPWQNGHVERLIGSIRRECLDRVVLFGEAHLRGVWKTYATSHWIKMRRISTVFYRWAISWQFPSLVDCIIHKSGIRLCAGETSSGNRLASRASARGSPSPA
ncbi:MAG: integrase core domain-containing protein, partial [Candidatus Binataceae bacterium]